ncbi:peptidase M4 [Streptomyces nitrosporeus]|uniref:Peptidase M4 n=1 Tax=Streptomyces nitrosporeus TaxID=28894 RepID=A0A5J6F7S8_9ACTN|nr:PepSY domain-containing protein [Streptomyces nitrosporeus]QEU72252.1 peptidase M4 [Streptomyces nitrosporeus]GGY79373.1 hypothetical protein GCM10010327_07220 [Streptomyces nitrosporeus]
MKHRIAAAAVAAAVLVGGGIAATAAFADDDGRGHERTERNEDRADDRTDDRADTDDQADGRAEAGRAADDRPVSLDRALAAALKAVPGTATEAELEDDGDDDDGRDDGRRVWEFDVYGKDKVWHDVTVDAANAKVLSTRDDDNDDRDRHAPRSASVTLVTAVNAALRSEPGTVTSVDLDDDDDDDRAGGGTPRWEIEITGDDGREHELRVDAGTAAVTVDRDDD